MKSTSRRGSGAGSSGPSSEKQGDCRAQLAELFAYLDGELSEARCRAIERHLASCECCDELAAGLRRAIAVCRASGRERLPSQVRARAQARVARLLDGGARPRSTRRPRPRT
jgi:anti-sigma factor RsiW